MENVIDLYEYWGAERLNASEGYLVGASYIHSENVRPCVLIIAGGGYDHVSPREQLPVAKGYAKNGFATFILNYSTKVPYPTAFFEAAMAMAFLKENAIELKIIANKIAVVGFSAGGHLAASLGIIPDDKYLIEKFEKVELLKNFNKENSVKPDAMVLCYPVITSKKEKAHVGSFKQLENGDNRLIEELSLENRVNNSSTPCFIWHTFNDGSVPVYNSLILAMKYEQNGVPFSLHVYEKGKHGLSVATSETVSEEDLKSISTGVSDWLKMSVNWLKDREF